MATFTAQQLLWLCFFSLSCFSFFFFFLISFHFICFAFRSFCAKQMRLIDIVDFVYFLLTHLLTYVCLDSITLKLNFYFPYFSDLSLFSLFLFYFNKAIASSIAVDPSIELHEILFCPSIGSETKTDWLSSPNSILYILRYAVQHTKTHFSQIQNHYTSLHSLLRYSPHSL